MEFIDVIKKRRSVRKYSNKKVSPSLINELIELANLSPSAGNIQARAVVVVKNKGVINEIRSITKGLANFEGELPTLLIILAKLKESGEKYAERGKVLYSLQDATIFASYLQLIAAAKGLSTCWVGRFDEEKITKILNLPKEVRPVAIIPLGYSLENPPLKQRKDLKDLIFKEI